MKTFAQYPPLVRMTYMSIAKTTPRKRAPRWHILVYSLAAVLFGVGLFFFGTG